MLFLIGGKIIYNAIERFINPVVPSIGIDCLIALVITLCINVFVSVCEYKQGKKLGSQILVSDSMHTRSDIYVSIGVLITLIGIKLGLPPVIDPITSLVVSGFILRAAYIIFKENSGILLDAAAVDIQKIEEIVLSYNQVKDVHNIRSRGSKNDMHVDMHIFIEPHMSIEESHELIHEIEAKIKQEINANLQLIAHLEPYK